MSRVVGFSEESWPHAKQALEHMRRGAIEHPFHRRQLPVLSSSGTSVFVIATSSADKCFGNRDSGGVVSTATGYEVLTYDTDGNPDTFDTEAKDLLFSWCRGILFHGDYVAAVPAGEKWRVISEGQSVFNNCGSGSGGTEILLPTGVHVESESPLTGPLADGTLCTAQWCAATSTFIINGAGCPSPS